MHYFRLMILSLCLVSITHAYKKVAIITGINGQDGSYLAEFLLKKGYAVHGIKRRTSTINTQRIDHLYYNPDYQGSFFLHYGDMTDVAYVFHIISSVEPDEIYNLAAQSHVKVSFELPLYTADVDALGTLRILEAIRQFNRKKIKFYQASTSEMFGLVQEIPQKETTPFYPRSPYAVAKLYAHWITKNYREAYGMFTCSGILFNHESPLRGETFVTRKITKAVAAIAAGKQEVLYLGNLNAYRDWGHARDYVEAMWLMLQQDEPDDFVIATGETHSVREFVELAFAHIGVEIGWEGEGVDEIGYDKNSGKKLVFVDQKYFRPAEVDFLIGDASKAHTLLGWYPKTTFQQLVDEMMCYELENVKKQTFFF